MPELPEVETVRRTLELQLQHPIIETAAVFWPRIVDNCSPQAFCDIVKGQKIQDYQRIGKYLIFVLDHHVIVSHLRMEGKYYVQQAHEPYDKKHTHAIFTFTNGLQLRYHDTRKFGRFYLYERKEELTKQKAFRHCGYDVFDERCTPEYLYQQLHPRRITLKQALLDQSVMAGVGNIYADEICFALGYDPEISIQRVHKKDFPALLAQAHRILGGAMKAGGTTIRSYTSSLGVDGRFQLQLKVHARKGQPCVNCGTEIIKKTVATRGTYYCPKCQRKR